MSQASDLLRANRASHLRVVGVASAAHFVSHYYMLLLAPLLPFVRADYNVSYTEIGLALAAFNIVSALLQTPTGFLADRLGPRTLLIGGLALGGFAFAVVGLVDSFWLMVAMFALGGLANTVYHPCDYALLSQHIPANRIGQAFSVHTFAGILGSAVAPPTLLMMQSVWGWRGAFVAAGLLGLAVAAVLLLLREQPAAPAAVGPVRPAKTESAPVGWRLLLSPPILINLAFFILLAMTSGAMNNYSVVALSAAYGTPVATGNVALSGHLLLMSAGVLVGGFVAGRTTRHTAVTMLGLGLIAALAALIARVDLGSIGVIAAMTVSGFFYGLIMPSRDMIVREATPPGAFGRVFGFVSTGFNIGGIVAPLVFGAIMDHGRADWVFLLVAAFSLAGVALVAATPRRPARAS